MPRMADEFRPALEWLGVLHCLRDTGMPIAQMRRYAELARAGQATIAARLNLLTEHDARVQERIALLQAQRKHLRKRSTGTTASFRRPPYGRA